MVDQQFGARLRQLRSQRGLTLRELAKLALSSKSHLHEFETSAAYPNIDTAKRIDTALGARGELVAMIACPSQSPAPSSEQIADDANGTLIGAPRLQYLAGGRRRVGAGVPAQLLTRTARLRRLDDFLGGADTFRTYAAEVDATSELLREGVYSKATGRALLAVVAEQAQLAGWAAFDAGWHADAERLYRLSLGAAQDAGSTALAGNALAFLAYQLLAFGQSGVDAATAAVDTARGDATPAVRALLHERLAWAHAIAGHADQSAEHLDLSETALQQPAQGPEPDWVFWVDDVELQIMTGRCWSVLHRPLRAITALEAALARYADTHARDKALYLTWLAQAYLDANEIDHACAVAGRAIDLVTGVGSVRPLHRITSLMSRLDEHQALPAVAELRVRAAEWVRLAPTLTPPAIASTQPPRPPTGLP
jgi:transcriptional regulator with XRE-family HTH domain